MIVKRIIDEDFCNYKKASMLIAFPCCNFKCEKECGMQVCQNSTLAASDNIEIGVKTICNRYFNNPLTSAIVCGGLEPFDSWMDLLQLISYIRVNSNDDIVIYTGYNKDEVIDKVEHLQRFENIVIKFGRFVPNQEKHYDEVLGIWLASNNQYAERIS